MFSWINNTRGTLAALVCAALLSAFGTGTAATRAAADPATDRIIVKWRDSGVAVTQIEALESRTRLLRATTGLPLQALRSLGAHYDVLRVSSDYDPRVAAGRSEVQAAIAALRTNPFVEFAEADERVYALALPNDPRFVAGSDALGQWTGQWYLGDANANTPAATGVTTAWSTSQGAGIVVAVIDTGIRLDHPDLPPSQLLPGRDFVCNDDSSLACDASGATQYFTANDGSGWDDDPSDPGDGLTASDLASGSFFFGKQCGGGPNHDQPVDSTWHGTRVAGIIAALTNNGVGIASVAPAAQVLPVRALGRCGGYTSDLVAAMLWAGGISDSSIGNLPVNPVANRARILNLSLGNRNACSALEQSAIDRLNAAGVLVVAAAGNDGGPIGAPANCNGVLSVAGVRHVGSKVGYSNVSSTAASISIAAPAGNCVNTVTTLPCLFAIDTLSNEGKLGPAPSNALTSYTYSVFNTGYTGNAFNAGNVGTSFAAPIVAGVAALMRSANTLLTPAGVIARMTRTATPFPALATPATAGVCHVAALTRDNNNVFTDVQNLDCQCTTATCGAGIVNAAAAVAAATRPFAAIQSSATIGDIGQHITLDGSGSSTASGHRIVGYQWSVDPNISVLNQNTAVAEIVFPATRPITVTLVVTDDAGAQDTATLLIASALTGTGSGGGGFGWLECLLLVLTGGLLLAGRKRELKRGPTVAMLCQRTVAGRALPESGQRSESGA